jgi:hypothetical protein
VLSDWRAVAFRLLAVPRRPQLARSHTQADTIFEAVLADAFCWTVRWIVALLFGGVPVRHDPPRTDMNVLGDINDPRRASASLDSRGRASGDRPSASTTIHLTDTDPSAAIRRQARRCFSRARETFFATSQ